MFSRLLRTIGAGLLIVAAAQGARCAAEPAVTASSFESADYAPSCAFDRDFQTRWSSAFSDPQWLLIDLAQEQPVSGLQLYWEQAYARSYQVQLSLDGNEWETVFVNTDGDGGTDEVYFRLQSARYIRLLCIQRATTWGNSLWEVLVKGAADEPVLAASSERAGSPAQGCLDGDPRTAWESAGTAEETLTIDWRADKQFGGFDILWGPAFAREYTILVSDDGTVWRDVFHQNNCSGGRDTVYLEPTSARFVRIRCERSGGNGYAITEFRPRGPDEAWTPQRELTLRAGKLPAGVYPRWLSGEQQYWTVCGMDGDAMESLLSEDGAIEPFAKSFSLIPYVVLGSELVTSAGVRLEQSLEEEYLPLPAVTWHHPSFSLRQRVFTAGEKGRSNTYAWYTIANVSDEPVRGQLLVSIRPFQVNPPWQYGGLSEIRQLEYRSGYPATVSVNGRLGVVSLTQPACFGARAFRAGDITDDLTNGGPVALEALQDDDGYGSGGLSYPFALDPGQETEVFLVLPLHGVDLDGLGQVTDVGGYVADTYEKTRVYWKDLLDRIVIDIPERKITQALKTNLAYILINNDDPKLQPGSRNYKRAWMRDGALISAALLRMGIDRPVREFLDWMSAAQSSEGRIPFILDTDGVPAWCRDWNEYDSQGEYLFSLLDYYYFTKDTGFLTEKVSALTRAVQYLAALRAQRLTGEYTDETGGKTAYRGILPESNSHEGYFPPVHSYWDDLWALKGLKDARTIADILGHEELAAWVDEEEKGFAQDLYRSMETVIREKGLSYIPGCVEKGDFDATSTAIGLFPCDEYARLPEPYLTNTFEQYYTRTFLPRLKNAGDDKFTPYEIRSMNAFLIMGEKEKALTMLRYFLTVMRPRPWHHWAEVVYRAYRHPQYIGDMPHTWIGAEYVTAIRNLFAYEEGGTLLLGAGIDPAWAQGTGVRVEGLPTYYGRISYTLAEEDEAPVLSVWGDAVAPSGIVFANPFTGERIPIESLPCRMTLQTDE